MMNQLIFDTSQICYALGIRDAVFSPGSRNAPLSISFSKNSKINTRVIVDERSAGFIALGIAQQTQRPVVLCCTSGSALLNYAPAVAEAFYSRTPLIILSTDRPSEWIDHWDGQTIRQQNVFQPFIKDFFQLPESLEHPDARWSYEIKFSQAINKANSAQIPVHLNIPFREPYYPEKDQIMTYSDAFKIIRQYPSIKKANCDDLVLDWNKYNKKIIVIGQSQLSSEAKDLLNQLTEQKIPIVADVISNANQLPSLIRHHDLFLSNESLQKYLAPDLIVSFGMSLISKNLKLFLRKNNAKHWQIDAFPESQDPFQKLTGIIESEPEPVLRCISHMNAQTETFYQAWLEADKQTSQLLTTFDMGFGEFKAVTRIIECLPEEIQVHLSNSMPVRYVNFLGIKKDAVRIYANRGTSGIDGSNGTAVGHTMASNSLSLLLTGDLSFLYDRNSFFHSYDLSKLRIIVFNNFGGGIFDLISGPEWMDPDVKSKYLTTPHERDLKLITQEIGFYYTKITLFEELDTALRTFFDPSNKGRLLEIQSTCSQNNQIFKALKNKINEHKYF